MLSLCGPTAQEVARRLSDQLELSVPKVPKLNLLPYNRFNLTGENAWWIVPSSHNPAYAVGKFFCSTAEDDCGPAEIRCGLYVEKGMEEGVEDPKKKMSADWEWHRFVEAMTTAAFANVLKAATELIDAPLQIDIVAKLGDQEEWFSANTKDGGLENIRTNLLPSVGALHRLSGCTNVADLGTFLGGEVQKALMWGWIDVYVSGLFKLVTAGADDIVKCARMLGQFEPWVRDGKRR